MTTPNAKLRSPAIAGILLLSLVQIGSLVHAGKDILSFRTKTVDWKSEAFTEDPPYLAGYHLLAPIRAGAGTVGRFLGEQLTLHPNIGGKIRLSYVARGAESDSEFVAVVALRWSAVLDTVPAVPGTLTVAIDDRPPVEIPTEFRAGTQFWNAAGHSLPCSYPQAFLIDLPEGKHEVTLSLRTRRGVIGLVVAGVETRDDGEAPTAAAPGTPGS